MKNIFSKDINMVEGNLFSKITLYSIPLILSALLQLFYTACDLVVCGRFGTTHSVGAISATNAFSSLLVNLFIGLSMGANVVMAKAYGADDKEKGKRIAYSSLILSSIAGVIVMGVMLAIARPGLKLMGTPNDIIDLSTQYMMIYALGIPFILIYNFGASILRAIGDSRRPFYILFSSGILNIGLNLLFVIPLHMDVAGVATATAISMAYSAVMVIICMIKGKGFFVFKFKELHIYKTETSEVLKVGLPVGIRNTLFSFSNILIQSSINKLANTYSVFLNDGSGAASSIEGFMYVAMNQVACACASFVSANNGAKNAKNIKKTIYYSLILLTIVWAITFAIMYPLKRQIAKIYISEEEAIQYALERMIIILPTYLLCGYQELFGNAMTGMGKSLISMIITVIGIIGFRIFWIYVVFPHDPFFSLGGLVWSYPISWTLLIVALIIGDIIIFKKLTKSFSNVK